MNISRRFFIGGLGAFALGPNRIFAAKPGTFTDGTPLLSFGALSDVHFCLAKGLTFSVRAISCWGKKSAPLTAKPLEADA